ncbi:MAG: hypothetical protein QXF58_05095 [Desulfurococcaceae archaeon]
MKKKDVEKFLNKLMRKKQIIGYSLDGDKIRIIVENGKERGFAVPRELCGYDVEILLTDRFVARK